MSKDRGLLAPSEEVHNKIIECLTDNSLDYDLSDYAIEQYQQAYNDKISEIERNAKIDIRGKIIGIVADYIRSYAGEVLPKMEHKLISDIKDYLDQLGE